MHKWSSFARAALVAPSGRASLWTGAVALLCLVDLLLLRPLHEAGAIDRVAAVVDDLVFLASLPGLVLATELLQWSGHHRPPALFLLATALNALLLWPLALVYLRHRARAKECDTGSPHRAPSPGERPANGVLEEGESPALQAISACDGAPRMDPSNGEGASRRALLVRIATRVAGLSLAMLVGWAVWLEPRWLRVRRLRLAVPGLPPELHGLTVLHLTDLHLGPFISEAYLRSVVDRANALGPDLVALTGDYVHGSPAYIPRVAALVGRLRPRLGVVGVLGNHDHWEGSTQSRRALRRAGVLLVEGRHFFVTRGGITAQSQPGSLCVGGVGDLWEDSPDLDRALAGVTDGTPRLLLCHNPDFAELPAVRRSATRVDLMLSGHTHGGQVRLPWLGTLVLPSEHGQKYARGLVAGPRFRVHISAGVGSAVLPVRLGVRPEMTLITLEGG